MAGVAESPLQERERNLVVVLQKSDRQTAYRIQRRGRAGALLWVDRQQPEKTGRGTLRAAFFPQETQKRILTGQHRTIEIPGLTGAGH